MGNCQAADVAAVVIQYPGGKVERLHWPTTAANVMKSNPGYHVALVTLCIPPNESQDVGVGNRITRVKLLKPKEMLLLGQVYRLITSQEVAKALRQRQYQKLRANFHDLVHVLAEDLLAPDKLLPELAHQRSQMLTAIANRSKASPSACFEGDIDRRRCEANWLPREASWWSDREAKRRWFR